MREATQEDLEALNNLVQDGLIEVVSIDQYGGIELLSKDIGKYTRTYARVRRDNQALSIVLLDNMISAFEPKVVGSVKIMAYAFRAETPIGKWRFPCGEFTRGSLWTECKTGWVGGSGRSRNGFIGDIRL